MSEFWKNALGVREGVWPPDAWSGLLTAMGRIVFNWNCLEQSFDNILDELIGGQQKAKILTAHMGSMTKADALRTLAVEYHDGALREHLLFVCQVFDTFRERRNFFVHSFNAIGFSGGPRPSLEIHMRSWSAKRKLKMQTMTFDEAALEQEAAMLHAAHSHLARVFCHLHYPDDPEYQTLPKRFALPDKLRKNHEYPLGE